MFNVYHFERKLSLKKRIDKMKEEYIKDNFSPDEIFDMDDYLKNVDIVKTFSENDIRDAARQIGIIDIQEYRDNQIDKIV